jgi:hypothetical protein
MRFPRINKFITYTTLTTWKFWRRYKFPNKRKPETAHLEGA